MFVRGRHFVVDVVQEPVELGLYAVGVGSDQANPGGAAGDEVGERRR